MKFEAFYKEAYDAEMEELFSDNASETENKPSKDSCDLLMKKVNLEFSHRHCAHEKNTAWFQSQNA